MAKSDKQGPFDREDFKEMHRLARKKRQIEMIRVLENNGYMVRPLKKAVEKENQQMINILESRGFKVLAADKIELKSDEGTVAEVNTDTGELTGVEGEKVEQEIQKEKTASPESQEKGTEESPKEEQGPAVPS